MKYIDMFVFCCCLDMRSESPNMSDGSDSTNYLTTVNVERYNNRSVSASTVIDTNNHHHHTVRYTPMSGQNEFNRAIYPSSLSKSVDPQVNHRSSKIKRSVEWDEENIHQNEGKRVS
jgi:hypothetical protein